MRAILVRVSLLLFGLLLSAIAVEAILQIGALYVRSRSGEARSWTSAGAVRVLSLGDSNTYGLHLTDRGQAYPSQLQTMWNRRFPEKPIEVMNAGVPGTNSSKLRNHFPALLRTFQPDVVTIMIGVNDYWTEAEPIRPTDVAESDEGHSLRDYSRLYRLVYMIGRATRRPEVEIEFANPEGYRNNRGTVRFGDASFDLGWTRKAPDSVEGWPQLLIDNCESMTRQARTAGVIPIFLTYAYQTGVYEAASATVRKAAGLAGAPLVDLQSVFRFRCADEECRDLYYATQHPTDKGHRLIANALLEKLAVMIGDVE